MKTVAIIIAGGKGARLWPQSTETLPKQYINFFDEPSLIEKTYNRIAKILPKEDIYVVTYESLALITKEKLKDLPESNLILEPFGRNTLPAILLATTIIKSKYSKEDTIIVLPSDHIIQNDNEFEKCFTTSIDTAVHSNHIVSIGIKPTRPGTQYGYIQFDDLDNSVINYDKGVRRTNVFAEKPDIETAKRFIESGDFIWNTGIFACKIPVFYSELEVHNSEYVSLFNNLSQFLFSEFYKDSLELIYKQINSVSIDYGLMEKTDKLLIIKGQFSWSDLGNWDEFYRQSLKDSRNNYLQGNVIAIDVDNSVVISNNKNISLVGVNDLIVVESENSILITKRGDSERVKEVIDHLRRQNMSDML